MVTHIERKAWLVDYYTVRAMCLAWGGRKHKENSTLQILLGREEQQVSEAVTVTWCEWLTMRSTECMPDRPGSITAQIKAHVNELLLYDLCNYKMSQLLLFF